MYVDYLRNLKDERKMTTQQLSEKSGVPTSSVHRIMSGQTDNPSFQAICDLVVALGGSLDEMVGIKAKPNRIDDSREIEMLKQRIAEKDRIIANKDRWLSRVACMAFALVVFILVAIIVDRLNGNFGYWRY